MEIEVYSLDPRGKGWELLCYQTPQPLYFESEECEVFFWVAEVVDVDYADDDREAGTVFC